MAIQKVLDESLILELNPAATISEIGMQLKRHPYPPYVDDPFIGVIQRQLPLIILLSFIIVAPNIVKDIVLEKERKLKVSSRFRQNIILKIFCAIFHPRLTVNFFVFFTI